MTAPGAWPPPGQPGQGTPPGAWPPSAQAPPLWAPPPQWGPPPPQWVPPPAPWGPPPHWGPPPAQWGPPQWGPPRPPGPSQPPPAPPGPPLEERPIRSHRSREPGNRLVGRLGAVALLVLALAAGALITRNTPDADARQGPYVRAGRIGQTLDLGDFDVRVLSVRGAAVISQSGATHDTSGIWVLVTVRLTSRHKPIGVGYMALRDEQGRTYRSSTRVDQVLEGGWTLQPGVPVAGEVAFEVPVAVATHVAILLAKPTLELRLAAMAEVPLPIDDASVRSWKAQTTPVPLTKPAVTS